MIALMRGLWIVGGAAGAALALSAVLVGVTSAAEPTVDPAWSHLSSASGDLRCPSTATASRTS
jgi:hypothetical protein